MPPSADDLEWFLGQLARTLGAQILAASATDEDGDRCRILRLDTADPAAERVLRRADVVVVLRDADRRPHGLEALRTWWFALDPLAAPRAELVLLRSGSDGRRIGTAAWTAAFPSFVEHHHVRRGVADDARRWAGISEGRRSDSCSAVAGHEAWRTSACCGR